MKISVKIPKKDEAKRLIKPFLLLFIISFLVINWDTVYWFFSYRAVSGVASELFLKIQNNIAYSTTDYYQDRGGKGTAGTVFFGKNNILEIPSLGISSPIIFDQSLSQKQVQKSLNNGTVIYPSSVLPGENGQTVILGHSAPPHWPKIKYDWVFSDLSKLKNNDEILIYFGNKQYTYHVTGEIFLDRGEELPDSSTGAGNTLFLVSCWPPGKDFKRIAVEAVL